VAAIVLLLPARVWPFEISETSEGPVLMREFSQAVLKTGDIKQRVRDPFNWPLEVADLYREKTEEKKEFKFAEMQLSGILWDAKSPFAIIDGLLLQEGESIKGVTVRSIMQNEVLLEYENEFHTLRFKNLFELGMPEVFPGKQ